MDDLPLWRFGQTQQKVLETRLDLVLLHPQRDGSSESMIQTLGRYNEGPFEILERIGLVADRLRLPEELSCVHDTFHVSNLKKKCLADASLHVSLDEIKVDKTLRFVEEPVENSDREVKSYTAKLPFWWAAKSLAVRYLVKVGGIQVIVDSEHDRLIFVDRRTRSVPLFVDVSVGRPQHGTDIAKITRKWSKPDKHEHGNGKSAQELEVF
ncbi:hypothetical protein Tco_1395048 [Tanacetum coccineum]